MLTFIRILLDDQEKLGIAQRSKAREPQARHARSETLLQCPCHLGLSKDNSFLFEQYGLFIQARKWEMCMDKYLSNYSKRYIPVLCPPEF